MNFIISSDTDVFLFLGVGVIETRACAIAWPVATCGPQADASLPRRHLHLAGNLKLFIITFTEAEMNSYDLTIAFL